MIDERGVSVALDYVIMLGIATIVLSSVAFLAGDVMVTHHDRSINEELSAIGETLAADIESANRLAAASGDPENATAHLDSRLPRFVGGVPYTITVNGSAGELRLQTTSPEVEVIRPVNAERLSTEEQSVRGGTVEINLVDGRLEVRNP